MICSKCGSPNVEWKGPITALTHMECNDCSAKFFDVNEVKEMPMIGTEEGATCNRDGCAGTIIIKPVENCSCHISPPCAACIEAPLYCPECLWESSDDE